jgi:hypothetical protein
MFCDSITVLGSENLTQHDTVNVPLVEVRLLVGSLTCTLALPGKLAPLPFAAKKHMAIATSNSLTPRL